MFLRNYAALSLQITTPLLLLLISNCADIYSAVRNIVYGVCAWHIFHGQQWAVNWSEIETAQKQHWKGPRSWTPPTSRRPKQAPWTPLIIMRIRSKRFP
ncbi:hypothetical protein B0H34DRAFT_689569 [Crassisporium funariophilum]|nr:hypothetical protein B0H34DRAFT_689569 [Crassisporium funariophilum]